MNWMGIVMEVQLWRRVRIAPCTYVSMAPINEYPILLARLDRVAHAVVDVPRIIKRRLVDGKVGSSNSSGSTENIV